MKEPWTWQNDDRDTDMKTLMELKKQLGLDAKAPLGDGATAGLDVEASIHEAVAEHAKPENSNNGFTKGHDFV